MRIQIAALVVAALIGFSAPAFAQQQAPAVEKLKFRKWDVGGSLGLLVVSRSNAGGFGEASCYCDNLAWAGNIDVGRYFTQHLKAEAGVLWTTTRHIYSYDSTYPQTFPTTYYQHEVDPVSVSAAMTYQFLENAFAHPYVSVGVRVTAFSEQNRATVYNPNFSAAPTVTTSSRKFTEARPFVAAGYKSYFNERVYLRPEALLAFDENGAAHGTVRLGFGIDF